MIKKILALFVIIFTIGSCQTVFADDEVKTQTYTPPTIDIMDGYVGKYDITATLRATFPDEYFVKNLAVTEDIIQNKRNYIFDDETGDIKETAYWYGVGYYLLPLQLQAYNNEMLKLGTPNPLLGDLFNSLNSKPNVGKEQLLQMQIYNLKDTKLIQYMD